MLRFAGFVFGANRRPTGSSLTEREILEYQAQFDPSLLDALEPPPLPPEAAHVWHDFLRLSRKRTRTADGPNPITYRDMSDYEERWGLEISEEGAAILDAIDDAYLASAYQHQAPSVMTPAAFGGQG